jgi:hypothetical protein
MIAESPARPFTTPMTHVVAQPEVSRPGLLGAFVALFERLAHTEAKSATATADRYWTSLSRGL